MFLDILSGITSDIFSSDMFSGIVSGISSDIRGLESRGVAAESLESRDLDALGSKEVMVVMKVEIAAMVVVMAVCKMASAHVNWIEHNPLSLASIGRDHPLHSLDGT